MKVPSNSIITVTADEKYLEHLMGLLYSLDQTNPTQKIHVCLIRIPLSVDKDLKKLHKHTVIQHDDSIYDDRPNRPPDPRAVWSDGKLHIPHPKLVSDKMCYCVQVKYSHIHTCMRDGAHMVYAVDADTLFRKDITPLWYTIDQHDITIMDNITDDSVKYNRKRAGWKEGAIGVKKSPITTKFFARVESIINDYGPTHELGWVIEDRALSMAYSEMKIDRAHLDPTFKCEDLKNTSHIWSGCGKTKYKSAKYKKEMKRYKGD
ncbi:hypothetical protein H8E06_01205 [bacterium]|nr:hypothetical protein [bacterium]